jgi:hypothetical protein
LPVGNLGMTPADFGAVRINGFPPFAWIALGGSCSWVDF